MTKSLCRGPFDRREFLQAGALGIGGLTLSGLFAELDPAAQEALDWFRTYIPERTLYNWQNAAAKLVAQDLRERMN